MMKNLTLGIVTAPGLANQMSEKILKQVSDSLNEAFDHQVEWTLYITVDQVTGAAESSAKIMQQAAHLKKKNDWDFAISLTDLPIFHDKFVVLADVNNQLKVAQISFPSLGVFPSLKKVQNAFIQMTYELFYSNYEDHSVTFSKKAIGIENQSTKSFNMYRKLFKLSSVKRESFHHQESHFSVRFLVTPKLMGKVKLIFGMTAANNPWSIMPSFKKLIGLAFATGSYMLIFNTLWQLSALYGSFRYILLMATAVTAMISWIIFVHNLWEKKPNYASQKLRFIYNSTTITTLTLSVLLFYISMFVLLSIAVLIFVPANMFESSIGHSVSMIDYLKLSWLVTSAATVAGAVGAGLEDEEAVRKATYGYRQYIRSLSVKEEEEKEEKNEYDQNNHNKS